MDDWCDTKAVFIKKSLVHKSLRQIRTPENEYAPISLLLQSGHFLCDVVLYQCRVVPGGSLKSARTDHLRKIVHVIRNAALGRLPICGHALISYAAEQKRVG